MQSDRGRSRGVAKFLQESLLIAFDFIWEILLSDRNFATLLDPPLSVVKKRTALNRGGLVGSKRFVVGPNYLDVGPKPLTK